MASGWYYEYLLKVFRYPSGGNTYTLQGYFDHPFGVLEPCFRGISTTFEGLASLQARDVVDCGESGWSAPFYTQVETCAGIATHTLSGLRLWPNPATAIFSLQLPSGATIPTALVGLLGAMANGS